MAISVTAICNKALIEIGETPIVAITDNSKAARTCAAVYDMVRDAALRSHRWNFAITRVALAESSIVPVYGFGKQFQLPVDCLKVIEIDALEFPYKLEGRMILTDAAPVYLKYVSRIEDPAKYDSLFVDYLALRLASDIAMTLTDNSQLRDTLFAKAALMLRDARTADAQEDTPDAPAETSWLTARR